MSSKLYVRPKAKPSVTAQQDPNGRKKPDEMTTRHTKTRLDSLTARRKPSWTWLAVAAGALVFALLVTLVLFDSFSLVGCAVIAGMAYVVTLYAVSRVVDDRRNGVGELWRAPVGI